MLSKARVAVLVAAFVWGCSIVAIKKTLGEIEEAFAAWLEGTSARLRSAFAERQRTNPTGASAEAAVWWFLEHAVGLRVEPGEQAGTGGPDFDCYSVLTHELVFSVEVTGRRDEPFETAGRVERTETGGTFESGAMAALCREAIQDKIRQAKRRAVPVLVAVCSTSEAAWLLLDAFTAERLLSGEQKIVLGREKGAEGFVKTDFEDSAFFVFDAELGPTAAAAAIAGALLVSVEEGGMHVIGALNPLATHQFAIENLRGVPFARASIDRDIGEMRVEWLVGRPAQPVTFGFGLLPESSDPRKR